MNNEKTGKNASHSPIPDGRLVRHIVGNARTIRLIYKQLLLVWLSFMLMAITTFFFVDDIMRQHLLTSTEDALSQTQAMIASDLAEPAMTLKSFSQSVRHMILRGESIQTVHDYLQSMTSHVLADKSRKFVWGGFYGWFDVFGVFLNDGHWAPPAGYVPQQRPWYLAAVAAEGEVAATQPYVEVHSPAVVISYARRIFDDAAKPLAVLSINVPLDRIGKYVAETRLAEGGYGILLSAQLDVIAHKDASMLGRAFSGISSSAASVADDLKRGVDVFERKAAIYTGEETVVSFRRLENGWHLGIVTPVDEYYHHVRHMAQFLFMLGVLLASLLSIAMLHIAHAKDKADRRTQRMLDAMPLCANLWSKDSTPTDCNQEAVKLFALSSKQEYIEKFHELSPKYQPCGTTSDEKATELARKVLQDGYCRFEWMHRKLDGELIPCEITLVRVAHEESFYEEGVIVLGYTRDLRELKAMMARLTAESAKTEAMAHWYKSILDNIPFPVSVTDAEAKWTFVNKAVEEFLGVKRDDIIGKPCSNWGLDICNADICNTADCCIARAKRGLKQAYFLHAGSSYQVDIAILKDLHGETTGFIKVMKDVTQLEQMAKRQIEAEAVSKAKSDFLAMVSHEIRTPMNVILGITEFQIHDGTFAPDTAEAFYMIYNAANSLLRLLNDILDLSKIEAGKMELLPAAYEVASLVNDTMQLNSMRHDSRPIRFTLELDENTPSLLVGDEIRIKQILNNLLTNAFKYTQEGEVTLSVSAEYGDREETSGVTLVLRVSDSGQGMTPEQVSGLFQEYARFTAPSNHAIEGVGLGLNITRQLTRMMNGEIVVESEPGRGSTFTVRLPQGAADSGVLGSELAENLRQQRINYAMQIQSEQFVREPMPYGRVLIVDDLVTNLYVAKGFMTPYKLSIDTATSGFEAIDKIRAGNEYDIVFMDHMMPEMDGVETTKKLRELGWDRPIVALTANAVVGQAETLLASGFDDFISKPIDSRLLNSVLNRLIRDKQPPEVIEAAWRQQAEQQKYAVCRTPRLVVDSELAEIFVREAAQAVAVLEALCGKQDTCTDEDIQAYVLNVHAMKSALAHVGETKLSGFAHKLEEAGRKRDIAVMWDETPAFLIALRELLKTIAPKEEGEDVEIADEDHAYLREKLLIVQAACDAYDKKTAKDALAELRRKVWSRPTREQLEAIVERLLHSDFEEAAELAERIVCEKRVTIANKD